MGVIHVVIPGIIPGPATQGKGRDRKGREKSGLRLHCMPQVVGVRRSTSRPCRVPSCNAETGAKR